MCPIICLLQIRSAGPSVVATSENASPLTIENDNPYLQSIKRKDDQKSQSLGFGFSVPLNSCGKQSCCSHLSSLYWWCSSLNPILLINTCTIFALPRNMLAQVCLISFAIFFQNSRLTKIAITQRCTRPTGLKLKNGLQAEVLLGDLSRAGFQISSEHEGTDAIIVNTCAFIDDAKAESLQVSKLIS